MTRLFIRDKNRFTSGMIKGMLLIEEGCAT